MREFEVTCKICGIVFSAKGRYRRSYCSDDCRLKGKALVHRGYAQQNKEHLRAYSRQRKLRVWGISSPAIGHSAELFALQKLLPLLGFTEIVWVSPIRRFIPFDFVATLRGNRVLVDVTTTMSRSGARSSRELAKALRMPFLRVFIKPDFTGYTVRDAFEGSNVQLSKVKPLPK